MNIFGTIGDLILLLQLLYTCNLIMLMSNVSLQWGPFQQCEQYAKLVADSTSCISTVGALLRSQQQALLWSGVTLHTGEVSNCVEMFWLASRL